MSSPPGHLQSEKSAQPKPRRKGTSKDLRLEKALTNKDRIESFDQCRPTQDGLVAVSTLKNRERVWDIFEIYATGFRDQPVEDLLNEEDFKRFLKYYTHSCSQTVLHPELPTVSSIGTTWKRLHGHLAATGRAVPREVRERLHKYIRSELDLPDLKKPQQVVQATDLDRLREKLWGDDDHEYDLESSRVQLALAINLFASSGGRIGDIVESSAYHGTNEALLFKDVAVCISPNPITNKADIHLEPRWRFRKREKKDVAQRDHKNIGERDSGSLEGFVVSPAPRLANNTVLFFLAVGLARDVFRDVSTIDEVLALRPSYGRRKLAYHKDRGAWPVFCRPGAPDKALGSQTLSGWLRDLGRRAGFLDNVTAHGIRRGFATALAQADVPVALRNQRLGHTSEVFYKNYLARLNIVDGQAHYEGREGHDTLHIDSRGLEYRWAPDLPHKPPPISALSAEVVADLDALDARRAECPPDERNALKKEKGRILRRYMDGLRHQHIDTRVSADLELSKRYGLETPRLQHASKFSVTQRFMPERKLLHGTLFHDADCHSLQGRSALAALVSLCQQNNSQALFLPGESPVNGLCPEEGCGKHIDSLAPLSRAEHIHKCRLSFHRSREVDISSTYCTRPGRKSGVRPKDHPFAEYCWLCYEWILNEYDWLDHVASHLRSMPAYYGAIVFRHTRIKPGFCPFCAADDRLAVRIRFQSWKRPLELLKHVQSHVDKLTFGDVESVDCPHPACVVGVANAQDMVQHLSDYHGIREPHNGRTLKRAHVEKEDASSGTKRHKGQSSVEGPAGYENMEFEEV